MRPTAQKNEVIVLSAFDPRASSVGRSTGIQIVDYHIPDVRHRGDITEDDPTKVATELKSIDPDGQCIVLFYSGASMSGLLADRRPSRTAR